MASRFVQRLAAVAGEECWKAGARAARNTSPGRVRSIGPVRSGARHAASRRVPRGRPRCPSPTSSWLRDPYTIAKHILDLRELDAVDLAPGAADRGIVIHGALSEFTKPFAAACPVIRPGR